jgi:hypothetical protein
VFQESFSKSANPDHHNSVSSTSIPFIDQTPPTAKQLSLDDDKNGRNTFLSWEFE